MERSGMRFLYGETSIPSCITGLHHSDSSKNALLMNIPQLLLRYYTVTVKIFKLLLRYSIVIVKIFKLLLRYSIVIVKIFYSYC